MALADLDDRAGMDEHALDLGCLVGAAHPAPYRRFVDVGRKVASGEAQQRKAAAQPGDDDLADAAQRQRIAAARAARSRARRLRRPSCPAAAAVGAVGLIGDDAEFGGRESLPRPHAAPFESPRAMRQGAPRRRPTPCGSSSHRRPPPRFVEQDLQVVRRDRRKRSGLSWWIA